LPEARRRPSLDLERRALHYASTSKRTRAVTDQTPIAPTSDARSKEEMAENAASAAAYLKTLAHEGRLMILCHLGDGEKSVGELEELLNMRQAAVSQMLARLREEGLVRPRRHGKTIYYSLADVQTQRVIGLLYDIFCGAKATR